MLHDALREGRDAEQREDWRVALAAYDRAAQLRPSARILLHQALCLVRIRQLRDAQRRLRAYEDVATRREWRRHEVEVMAAQADALRALGHLRVQGTLPDGATVEVDGSPVTRDAEGRVDVDPGARALRVSAEGFTPFTVDVTVAEGATVELPVRLTPLPRDEPLPPPRTETATPAVQVATATQVFASPPRVEPRRPSITRTWWFWAGVGALVGITAAVTIATSGTDPPPPSTTGQVLGAVRSPGP